MKNSFAETLDTLDKVMDFRLPDEFAKFPLQTDELKRKIAQIYIKLTQIRAQHEIVLLGHALLRTHGDRWRVKLGNLIEVCKDVGTEGEGGEGAEKGQTIQTLQQLLDRLVAKP